MDKTLISIIIACRNEVDNIRECIEHAAANANDLVDVELLVIDGMSDDGTRDILADSGIDFPSLRIIDNEEQTTPQAFNLGINAAEGEYILIIGSRMFLSPDYASICLKVLQDKPEVKCVGGKLNNEFSDDKSEAIAAAMDSSFGVGGGNWRVLKDDTYVDTITAPFYHKAIFDEIGLFDEQLIRNQDDELNYRLTEAGHKIWLTQEATLRYVVRADFSKLFRQYFQYGYWKVYVNRKHSTVTSTRQLVPMIFVGGLVFGILLSYIHSMIFVTYLLCIGIYALAAMIMTTVSNTKTSLKPYVFFSFLILHVGYGSGYWIGLIDFFLLGRKKGREAQTKLSR